MVLVKELLVEPIGKEVETSYRCWMCDERHTDPTKFLWHLQEHKRLGHDQISAQKNAKLERFLHDVSIISIICIFTIFASVI